jgi:hypothetical protein
MLTRRAPLKRGAPLRRAAPPKRRAKLRQRSASSSARRRRAAQDGPQAALCRTLPCSCGCGRGPSQAHHEPPKSCGGKDRHTVPLWWECHRRRHRIGARAFWAAAERDPETIQAELQAQLDGRLAA